MSFAPGAQEEEKPPPARQNPILRAYFSRQLGNMRSFGTRGTGRRDPFLDDYVDRQIDHYLSELREKLADLNNYFAQVEQAQEAIRQGSSTQVIGQARVQWRNAIKDVQDEASDVWNMLRYVFTVLEDKGDLKPVKSQEPDSLYENETQFIGEQIGKAEKRITEYLFRVESVIQVEDLKGRNMLIHLYLAREMAKKIRKLSG
ncbi:MAG: hypothetical protein O7G29_10245 [Acidobacteria bacterium]|nr:hypothetical protein [Acidobacteriota bacterium]